MRKLDEEKASLSPDNGVPVGELGPLRRKRFVPSREALRSSSCASD